MPFEKEFDEIYSDFIKNALSEAGYEVSIAKDLQNQGNILRDIVEYIHRSNLIVADLTTLNPNVFYELGIAHALKKPVIMLAQNIDEVPFDLKQYRIVMYDTHFTRIKVATKELREIAEKLSNNQISFGNPILDFENIIETTQNDSVIISDDIDIEIQNGGGYLDHLVQNEDGMLSAVKSLGGITDSTMKYQTQIRLATQKINNLSKDDNKPGQARKIRNIVNEVAIATRDYSNDLRGFNDDYYRSINISFDSLEYIIEYAETIDDDYRESLRTLLTSFSSMEDAIDPSRGSVEEFITVLSKQKNLQKEFEKYRLLAIDELKTFISNIDLTIIKINRARDLIQSKLGINE